MTRKFHKFRAPTLNEAYKAMEARLGKQATVLQTTTVNETGLRGLLGHTLVEITAAVPEPVNPRTLSPAERKYAQAMLGALARETISPSATDAPPVSPAPSSVGTDETVQDTVEYFKQIVSDAQSRLKVNGQADGLSYPSADAENPPMTPIEEHAEGVSLSLSADARTHQIPADGETQRGESILPFRRPQAPEAGQGDLRNEIRELREMMHVLTAETPGAGLPAEFAPHYQALLKQGLDRKHAAALLSAASKSGDLRILRDPVVFFERLKMEIRKRVTVSGGIHQTAGKRRIVALMGPTGVGKTTTLAKLAALFAVQRRAHVGVITTDTYRVAATDQLRVYANIIGVDMRVVHEPKEMTMALRDFRDCDLVLIDTAGGSPYNLEQLNELEKLLLVAHPDECLLIMNATTPLEDLRAIHSQFARLKPSALLFSKLDETQRYGPLYCIAAEADLPISYLTTGQNVPDDLELASEGYIANLVVEAGDRRGTARAKSS